jgi:hypothetical protein
MAAITLCMALFQSQFLSFSRPTRRLPKETLDRANRQIGFAIANALEEHNLSRRRAEVVESVELLEVAQAERNRMLLEAYGSRDSLQDMEKALEMSAHTVVVDQRERNRRLLEAYGDKSSLKDMERAMQVYEVQ